MLANIYIAFTLYLKLFTYHLHGIRYYKYLRDDLKYTGDVCRLYVNLCHFMFEHLRILVSTGVLVPICYRYQGITAEKGSEKQLEV